MKKYFILLVLSLIPSVSRAEIPNGIMGFMDGKLYTQEGFTTGIPDYICFMDNNCYNKKLQWVFKREVQLSIKEVQNDSIQGQDSEQLQAELKRKEAEYNTVCIHGINDLEQKLIDLRVKYNKDLENFENQIKGQGMTSYSADMLRRSITTQFSKDTEVIQLQIQQKTLDCKRFNN